MPRPVAPRQQPCLRKGLLNSAIDIDAQIVSPKRVSKLVRSEDQPWGALAVRHLSQEVIDRQGIIRAGQRKLRWVYFGIFDLLID